MEDIFTSSKTPVTYRTERLKGTHPSEHDIFHRHGLLEGFDQAALEKTHVSLIGAGGLGSEIGMALVRKGIGELNIFDHDLVDITNLARQHYFKDDLYKPKALRLAENLTRLATGNSVIRGIPMMFQDAVDRSFIYQTDIAIVGVDNNDARFFCSDYFREKAVVFTAVSPEADSGYVFVQLPGDACFGCMFGDQFDRPERKCNGSTIDINKVMGGFVSYAVDPLIMQRPRDWNYKRICFHGPFEDMSRTIKINPDCQFCGGRRTNQPQKEFIHGLMNSAKAVLATIL